MAKSILSTSELFKIPDDLCIFLSSANLNFKFLKVFILLFKRDLECGGRQRGFRLTDSKEALITHSDRLQFTAFIFLSLSTTFLAYVESTQSLCIYSLCNSLHQCRVFVGIRSIVFCRVFVGILSIILSPRCLLTLVIICKKVLTQSLYFYTRLV